ncbi:uncharacterized protein LOC129745138 isoform X2 [Uranotaenia lowii]|uniref:uncharacterized protein LOC129745138 isoform X2 n=1 Tax=Uranotaenia lowii TaxID=190385 RepID=UPI00247850D3|nr:uncharacterized protein LOC129745138 isoform X2 [Uranotaenia lowii]
MPSKKGGTLRKYKHQDMLNAVAAVDQGLSLYMAAKTFKVPRSTLTGYYENRNRSSRSGHKLTFTNEEEKSLVAFVRDLRGRGMLMRRSDLAGAARWILETYPVNGVFRQNTLRSSWRTKFTARHPEINHFLYVEALQKTADIPASQCFEKVYQNINILEVFDCPERVFRYSEIKFREATTQSK